MSVREVDAGEGLRELGQHLRGRGPHSRREIASANSAWLARPASDDTIVPVNVRSAMGTRFTRAIAARAGRVPDLTVPVGSV